MCWVTLWRAPVAQPTALPTPSKKSKYLKISHWVIDLINSNVLGTMAAQMDFIFLYGINRSNVVKGVDPDLVDETVSGSLALSSPVYTMICSDWMLWLHTANLETEPKFLFIVVNWKGRLTLGAVNQRPQLPPLKSQC